MSKLYQTIVEGTVSGQATSAGLTAERLAVTDGVPFGFEGLIDRLAPLTPGEGVVIRPSEPRIVVKRVS